MLKKFLDKVVFSNMEDFRQNFKIKVPKLFNFGYDVVDEWARTEPQKQALCWTNNKGEHIDFTFEDIKRESDKTASYLQSLGIGKGDMVMLILKRRYEFWFVLTALHKIGAVAIPATYMLTAQDIIYRNNAAGVKMIVSVDEPALIEHINAAKPHSPTLETVVGVGDNIPVGWRNFRKEYRSAPDFVRPEHVNTNDDISLMYFTSGTSGEPKMVAHDYTYPLGHISTAKYWQNVDEKSLHFTLADTGWGKAVWGKLYGQWICGANVFVYDHERFNPKTIMQLVEDYNITSFCAPPTAYSVFMREKFSGIDISSIRYYTTAGEALDPSLYDEFKAATGLEIHEGFGQTETTATIITFPWTQPKAGSMGVPNPQYDIDLINEDGQSVKDGEPGEIVIRLEKGRPLGLFREYYKDPERTAKAFANNMYHTGDIAVRDGGYLHFIGRNDDLIKSKGYRIGPFEVESAIMTHPAVLECAVTGKQDVMRGQIVKATIVLTPEYKERAGEKLIKDIQRYVKSQLAEYKMPRVIEFVEELPKTISGKIKRAELRMRDMKIHSNS